MSAILEGTPDKKLALVTGRAYPEQAQETAKYLGTDVLETTAYDFANGEMYVRYTEPVRGADAFVMQAHTEPINKWIMEQLIMVDAMKRASAREFAPGRRRFDTSRRRGSLYKLPSIVSICSLRLIDA